VNPTGRVRRTPVPSWGRGRLLNRFWRNPAFHWVSPFVILLAYPVSNFSLCLGNTFAIFERIASLSVDRRFPRPNMVLKFYTDSKEPIDIPESIKPELFIADHMWVPNF
jgi:hypothetical protein